MTSLRRRGQRRQEVDVHPGCQLFHPGHPPPNPALITANRKQLWRDEKWQLWAKWGREVHRKKYYIT